METVWSPCQKSQEPLPLCCFLISASPFFLEGSLAYHFNPTTHSATIVQRCFIAPRAFHRPFSSSRKVKTPSRPLSSGRAWLSTHGRGALVVDDRNGQVPTVKLQELGGYLISQQNSGLKKKRCFQGVQNRCWECSSLAEEFCRIMK